MAFENMLLDDRYLLLRKIGGGGTSVVFLAEDVRLRKKWAVKIIDRDKARQRGYDPLYHTTMEANHLKRLRHPLFPQIIDLIYHEEAVFIVMDYVEGVPLHIYFKQNPENCIEQRYGWMKSLTDGISYLHKQSPPVLYLDLKPSNIMVCSTGTIRLIDFGIAQVKNSPVNRVYGTKGYAAPEQYAGSNRKIDERTDIYGLGAVFCFLFTGKPPGTDYAIQTYKINTSDIVEKYRTIFILKKCLNQNPNKRFKDSEALLKAIHQLEKGKRKKKTVICILTVIIMVLVFTRIQVQKQEGRYLETMQEAEAARDERNYQKALQLYCKAIEDTNGKKDDAYLGILAISCERGEVQSGIDRVVRYLDHFDAAQKDAVYFQIGWLYFQELNDYPKSRQWMEKIEAKQYPEVSYYIKIADVIEKNDDQGQLETELAVFLEYLNTASESSLTGYYAITAIAIMYGEGGYTSIDQAVEAGKLGRKIGDDEWKAKFRRQLMILYEKNGDYEEAIQEGLMILEEPLCWYNWQLQIQSYLQIARLYERTGSATDGIACLEQGIDRFPEEEELYLQCLLLGTASDKNILSDDKITYLYEKCLEFPELKEDVRFEKLQSKVKYILKKKEE